MKKQIVIAGSVVALLLIGGGSGVYAKNVYDQNTVETCRAAVAAVGYNDGNLTAANAKLDAAVEQAKSIPGFTDSEEGKAALEAAQTDSSFTPAADFSCDSRADAKALQDQIPGYTKEITAVQAKTDALNEAIAKLS